MIVTCAECGTEFDGVRSSATLCSARCRQRASRKKRAAAAADRGAKVLPLTAKSAAVTQATSGASKSRGALSVESRVLRELGEAADTAMGQACLLIARRLDDRVDASGAAVSSLVGRLERLMDTIQASRAVAEVESDASNPITFLQERAKERIARAGVG